MIIEPIMQKANEIYSSHATLPPYAASELVSQTTFSPQLIKEMWQWRSKRKTEAEEMMLGALAGRYCHDTSKIDFFGYTGRGLNVHNGRFNSHALAYSEDSEATGKFGTFAFQNAKNPKGSGNFGGCAFDHSYNGQGSGKFDGLPGVSSKRLLLFIEKNNNGQVLAPEDSIVVFRHGKLYPPLKGIALGVNYSGEGINHPNVASIKPEELSRGFNALQPDFPDRFAYLLDKHGFDIPPWLGNKMTQERIEVPIEI